MEQSSPSINPVNPVDTLLATIAIAIDSWKKQNSPETLTKTVHNKLDKAAEEVLFKMLGFDARYGGGWSVDHCNGREGNSVIGDYLRTTQERAVKAWFDEVGELKISPAFKKKIEKAMNDEYQDRMMQYARDLASKKAAEDLTVLLNQVCTSNQIGNYMKTLALIDNQPKAS